MMAPKPDEIHLWLTFTDKISDETLFAEYRRLLTGEERHRAARFYFERDRRQYLVTRALVRTVLSRYASVSPEDWAFATNAHGRPFIVNPGHDDDRLVFNVSHTAGLIVLGVTAHRGLGVDAENLELRRVALDIADHYFAQQEALELAALPVERQPERLIEYWTLKESYTKARGMGLSIPLDKFSFRLCDPGRIEFATHPGLADVGSRWQFWQFRPSASHLVAVCAERRPLQTPKFMMTSLVPLAVEQRLEAVFLRASE
jgi:4'-phosphopantetheinyl transferase